MEMQGYGPKQGYSKFRNSIDRKKRASLSFVLFFEHRVEKCSKIFPMGYDIYGTIETFEIAFKTTSKILLPEEL